jgi:hypothetical protein
VTTRELFASPGVTRGERRLTVYGRRDGACLLDRRAVGFTFDQDQRVPGSRVNKEGRRWYYIPDGWTDEGHSIVKYAELPIAPEALKAQMARFMRENRLFDGAGGTLTFMPVTTGPRPEETVYVNLEVGRTAARICDRGVELVRYTIEELRA